MGFAFVTTIDRQTDRKTYRQTDRGKDKPQNVLNIFDLPLKR